ncbi:MAG: DMT family transporter [Fibrobacterota bacterium]
MMPYIAITITILLFSTIEVAVKLIPSGGIDHNFLAALRFLIPGIILLIIKKELISRLSFNDILRFCVLGSLGIGATFGVYHHLLSTDTRAEEMALVFSSNPLFATLFATVLLREKIKLPIILATLGGIVGVYIMENGVAPLSSATLPNSILMIFTAVSFGFYTSAGKKLALRFGTLFTTGMSFCIGGLTLLPLSKSFAVYSPHITVPIILYLSLGTTLVGYLCYFYGLKRVSVVSGSALFYLKPLLATILAFILLDTQAPKPHFYAGMALLFMSLSIVINPRRIYEKK